MVNKGAIDSLLVWKLDRLARNPVDGGSIIWAIEEKKLKAIHASTVVHQHRQRQILDGTRIRHGEKKYVDDLSDNVKRGLRAKLEDGWYRPGSDWLFERLKQPILLSEIPGTFIVVRKI